MTLKSDIRMCTHGTNSAYQLTVVETWLNHWNCRH